MKWNNHYEWQGKSGDSDIRAKIQENWWTFGSFHIGLRKRETSCFRTFEIGFFRNTERYNHYIKKIKQNAAKLGAMA